MDGLVVLVTVAAPFLGGATQPWAWALLLPAMGFARVLAPPQSSPPPGLLPFPDAMPCATRSNWTRPDGCRSSPGSAWKAP